MSSFDSLLVFEIEREGDVGREGERERERSIFRHSISYLARLDSTKMTVHVCVKAAVGAPDVLGLMSMQHLVSFSFCVF